MECADSLRIEVIIIDEMSSCLIVIIGNEIDLSLVRNCKVLRFCNGSYVEQPFVTFSVLTFALSCGVPSNGNVIMNIEVVSWL